MLKGDFLEVFRKHSLFLMDSESLSGREDEAVRSGGQSESGANGEPGERPEDPETAWGSGAAMDDTSAGGSVG